MKRRASLAFREPVPGEVRQAGFALVDRGTGYTVNVDSCEVCAKALGCPWTEGLFEGTCTGCDVLLSGVPNSR